MSITYNTTRTPGQVEKKKKSWKSDQVTGKKKNTQASSSSNKTEAPFYSLSAIFSQVFLFVMSKSSDNSYFRSLTQQSLPTQIKGTDAFCQNQMTTWQSNLQAFPHCMLLGRSSPTKLLLSES